MIFTLENTSTREISKQLVSIREKGNQVTTGRVLTLIVVVDVHKPLAPVLESIHNSSREHPSRVLIMIKGDYAQPTNLNAEIRIGGDAGASEIIIMHVDGEVAGHLASLVTPLLLPDTPIVAWWPYAAPFNPSTDEIGIIAQRRITDALGDPAQDAIYRRRTHYTPGDSDLSWSRLTPWRGVLASALDQPPHTEITGVDIYGPAGNPSVDLAAGWLADRLSIPISRHTIEAHGMDFVDHNGTSCHPVSRVDIHRENGTVSVSVVDAETMAVSLPERPQSLVAQGLRSDSDCLSEELRHLDPDNAYARALRGLSRVHFIYGDATTDQL
ncbi:glucose-6-phosphate dehydrogenase assembly protein OpcA [Corynebacterium epidermidicanis]|uniref:Glucose-6-P dehydrogenase subunit n=1 Tax=Corynebacterium epidermidicanis TaxID=1050174 RepID=A0A0G3GWK5_9CORY|nr:glucose-6-phosphate dehydrogenase assembly protein OpcA [Corynebacterium epidermidicanis]AKK03207.1 glucose-6-P dehydrogenase subunit [Corynebacterium epidermidicanis]